jgi:hypothetical protein
MRRSSELNDFDRTSLLKSMTDIKSFTFQQRRQMLDEIFKTTSHQETPGHPPYQLKDLNHILLAYYTDPKLFEDKRAQIE